MAGYSLTPLPKKLGIKPGMRICFVNEPASFRSDLGTLAAIEFVGPSGGELDLAVLFSKSRRTFETHFAKIARRLKPAGMLWVAWPKKSSGIATDLSEDVVRDLGLAAGLVDTKVCAIDDVWSGLKFVYRLKDRPPSDRSA